MESLNHIKYRPSETVYWDTFTYSKSDTDWYLGATEKGLTSITIAGESFEEFSSALEKKVNNPKLIHSPEKLANVKHQLTEYFAGRLQCFDLPLDLRGTDFQKSVWEILLDTPYGETTTYNEIAKQLGNEKASRAVGAANGANPIPIIVPCHRVIGSNGSLIKFRGGVEMKRDLIQLEKKGKLGL